MVCCRYNNVRYSNFCPKPRILKFFGSCPLTSNSPVATSGSCNLRRVGTWIRRELRLAVWAWDRCFGFRQFVVVNSALEVRNSEFKFASLNLRIVAMWSVAPFYSFNLQLKRVTDVLALKRTIVLSCRSSKSEELNEVGEYISRCVTTWNPVMQILACRKFDIFHRVEQHDSCHFSSETHLTKYLIRGFYTTNNRVLMPIALPGNYK